MSDAVQLCLRLCAVLMHVQHLYFTCGIGDLMDAVYSLLAQGTPGAKDFYSMFGLSFAQLFSFFTS